MASYGNFAGRLSPDNGNSPPRPCSRGCARKRPPASRVRVPPQPLAMFAYNRAGTAAAQHPDAIAYPVAESAARRVALCRRVSWRYSKWMRINSNWSKRPFQLVEAALSDIAGELKAQNKLLSRSRESLRRSTSKR